jgi:hypothetical protein
VAETATVASYIFEHAGVTYELIDTPGFDDTNQEEHSDGIILEKLAGFLAARYGDDHLLSGMLYLHPISYSRVRGSTMTQLRVFEKLCGPDFFEHVVMGTTFWEAIDADTAVDRETEFFETANFFGYLKESGARNVRLYQTPESCLEVLEMFAQNSRAPMQIQTELANGMELGATGAALALSSDLAQLRTDHDEELRVQREQNEQAERETAERAQAEEETTRLRLEAQRLEEDERRRREEWRLRETERENQRRRREEAAAERRRREEEQRRAEIAETKRKEQLKREAEAAENFQKTRQEEARRAEARRLAIRKESDRLALIRHSKVSLQRREHVSPSASSEECRH